MFILHQIGPSDWLAGSMARNNRAGDQQRSDRRTDQNQQVQQTNNVRQSAPLPRPLGIFVSFVNQMVSNISGRERTLLQIALDNWGEVQHQIPAEQQSGINNIRTVLHEPQFAYLAQITAFNIPSFRERLQNDLASFLRARRPGPGASPGLQGNNGQGVIV